MIEEAVIDYGVLGLFVAYLIFDRQVLLRKLTNTLDKLTNKIDRICTNA